MNPNDRILTGQSNVQLSQTTVLDLNSDCLLKIFRYFKVEEMAIASDACRRFRDVACEAFKYEWKTKKISLSDADQDSRIASMAILRNFGHQLQKIYIHFDGNWNEHIFEMVIEKCSSQQLTEVYVSHKIIERDNIDRFKNKFINLTGLGLENTQNDIDLYEQFPTLEKLTLFGKPFENEHVVQFISLHPQVKNLHLEYIKRLDSLRNLLESVDQHLPQLEQLELAWMPGDAEDTDYQPKFFKNLKRLKFYNFGNEHLMHCLSISNEKVEQLEFKFGAYDSDVADFICRYKEVKKLSIHDIDYPVDYKDLLKLNDHLPKLAEFEISSQRRNINHQAIVQFVLGSKQLVTLSIEDFELENILEVKKDLQRKLDITKWSVDCNLSINELKIRKLSNRNHQLKC